MNENLHNLFIEKLRELYDAENQIILALPEMAGATPNEELIAGFEEHLEQTKKHASRLEDIATSLGFEITEKESVIVKTIISEGKKMFEKISDPNVLDAALIAGA